MHDTPHYVTTATVTDFLLTDSVDDQNPSRDRQIGIEIFLRLTDLQRVHRLSALIDAWLNHEPLNPDMVGGFFRQGWDCEPYLDGFRAGSYFTAVAARAPGGAIWSMGEVAFEWGDFMMTAEERVKLNKLAFPNTVHRGGTGSIQDLALGASWTLDPASARFYAQTWPKRRGCSDPPMVLSLQVGRDDIAALLDDRGEGEVLLPDAYALFLESMKPIKFGDGEASTNIV